MAIVARYIRIVSLSAVNGNNPLELKEVRVLGRDLNDLNDINWASGGTHGASATQSSDYNNNHQANRAIGEDDDDEIWSATSNDNDGDKSKNPWWQVDLGPTHRQIKTLEVRHGRFLTGQSNLTDYLIFVSTEELGATPNGSLNDIHEWAKDENDIGVKVFRPTRSIEGIVLDDGSLGVLPSNDPRWELQNPYVTQAFATDNPNYIAGVVGITASSSQGDAAFAEIGINNSALEHRMVEEIANASAVSTAKGIQWANQKDYEVEKFEGTQSQNVIDQLFLEDDLAHPNPTTNAIDKAFRDNTRSAREMIKEALRAGKKVTVPTRQIAIGSWVGVVWHEEDESSYGALILRVGETVAHGGAAIQEAQPKPPQVTKEWNNSVIAGDPVNTGTGSYTHDETDFTTPNYGLPPAESHKSEIFITLTEGSNLLIPAVPISRLYRRSSTAGREVGITSM